jgi:hypothetical protein
MHIVSTQGSKIAVAATLLLVFRREGFEVCRCGISSLYENPASRNTHSSPLLCHSSVSASTELVRGSILPFQLHESARRMCIRIISSEVYNFDTNFNLLCILTLLMVNNPISVL